MSGKAQHPNSSHGTRATAALLFLTVSPCLLMLAIPQEPEERTLPRPTPPALPEPERRALAFLSLEVPLWPVANRCFSCHNNGDAARALYRAHRLYRAVKPGVLESTTRWLSKPAAWEQGGEEYKDPVLATLQFSTALVEALDDGRLSDPRLLRRVADLLAGYQRPDGSWEVNPGTVGSPAAYGTTLATALARRTLVRAGHPGASRAEAWLRKKKVVNVFDAASVLIALEGPGDEEAWARRRQCLELIRRGQTRSGGWGPYVQSAPEPFDTALVLLALATLSGEEGVAPMRQRGRAWLVAAQKEGGSWPETTRPAGAESYAQRLSTCGWATLALLATPPEESDQ
jgi:Squalene-hopene cyclase C-terminal domain